MKTDLTDEELMQIRSILKTVPSVGKAVLFGSRAMGLARSNSDVDIMLYGDGLKMIDIMQINRLLEETTLPYHFDLIRYDVKNQTLLDHVKQYGKVIFEQEGVSVGKNTWCNKWKQVQLQHIASVQTGPFGSQLHNKDYVLVGTPIVTVEHLGERKMTRKNLPHISEADKNRLSKYLLQYGDLLFSRVGSVDRCSWVSEDEDGWMFSGRCLRVRPINPEKIYHKYLYYFFNLESTKNFVRDIAVGATMPSINTQLLSEIPISYPDIVEQRRIGDILSCLDDMIENNNAINHRLEEMAQAIFKSWFVDFEPWGGVMPNHWRAGTLSEIAKITMGQSPDGVSYNEIGDGTVFYQGRAEFGLRFPTRRLFTTQPKRMAAKGDVLVSIRAPVGDLNVTFESCCLGRGLAGIQSNSDCQSFVLYTMFALKQQLEMFNGEGTVFGSINKDDMANLPVLIPPDNMIHRFEELIRPIDATIEANYAESCYLQDTRDTLLPRLMSGELSVVDIKR